MHNRFKKKYLTEEEVEKKVQQELVKFWNCKTESEKISLFQKNPVLNKKGDRWNLTHFDEVQIKDIVEKYTYSLPIENPRL